MTFKLRLILLIILGLMLAAMISKKSVFVWITLPLLLYLLTGLMTFPRKICLSANRIVSHRRYKAGDIISITLVIENNGGEIPSLQIHESIKPQIQLVNKSNEKYRNLKFNEKTEFIYTFKAPRGKYYWDKIQVSVYDPLNLFEQIIELPAKGEVVVLPDEILEQSLKIKPRYTLKSPGLYQSNQPGSGVNFLGIREYLPGDSLRSIHWRLSARHPRQLFSKEFERDAIADVGLIVDGSAAMNLQAGNEYLFESSVRIAATIAKNIISDGNRLSLLIMGDRLYRVFPGTGKQQLARVLNQLAESKPGENVTLATINYLPVKLFPSHALIFIISPLSEKDVSVIFRLVANGYQVNLVSPDPVEFVSKSACHPLAVRAAALERISLLRKVQKMGVNVLNWTLEENDRFFIKPKETKSGLLASLKPYHRGKEYIIPSLNTLPWKRIKLMLFSIGIGFLLSISGLQIHVSLPFEVIVLAILLLLFCLHRFYLLMTN